MKVFDQARELMGQGKQEKALEEAMHPLALTDENGRQVNLARAALRLSSLLEDTDCKPPQPEVLYALLLQALGAGVLGGFSEETAVEGKEVATDSATDKAAKTTSGKATEDDTEKGSDEAVK